MKRATTLHHHWPADQEVGRITLAFEDRHRRRIVLTDDDGGEFLLDLAQAHHLSDGDGLALDEGGFIRVIAAEEEVAEVTAANPEDLARIAWHIGNRHMPLQVLPGGVLRLPADHVLIAMLEGLGATISRRIAPFQPEKGAYHSHGA